MTHTQGQLFAAGPVKITYNSAAAKARSARRERKGRLFDRLVGQGTIRTDPTTGKKYQCNGGRASFKRAYEWICRSCGQPWFASTATHRRADVICGNCRAGVKPLGSLRQTLHGYIQIKREEGWVLVHREVMESHLGRPLRSDEQVQHTPLPRRCRGSLGEVEGSLAGCRCGDR